MPTDRKPEFFKGAQLKVGIIGCGYVGLPLALRFAEAGHKVTGFVRNLPDGRVELVVEGDRHKTEGFLEAIRDRLGNHIRDERHDVGPATGEFTAFEIS